MKVKRIIEIEEDTLKRIDEAKSVPDMYGTDIVNGLNAIKNGTPYNPSGECEKCPFKHTEKCDVCGIGYDDYVKQYEVDLLINNAPTVHDTINLYTSGEVIFQQTRPQGEWIDYSDDGFVECPFCGSCTTCKGNKDELHFCFSCGADMRGNAK